MSTKTESFKKRLKSMLGVDLRRMFTSPLFYIMVGICLVIPILVLIMTQMMEGSPMTDQNGNAILDELGNPVLMEGFKNVWQIIGTSSGDSSAMGMDITSMCNINMMFFLIAVFICIFIADDFRSGYAKNLFTVRAKKTDYIVSKIIVGFIAGASMLVAFFIGAMIGGAIAGLPFALEGANAMNIIMCMLSKIFLSLVFISIFVLASVIAKKRLWLSIILSLGIGMLFFMMVPMITPLNAGLLNVILCLAGGVGFAVGFGAISNIVLKKSSLV